MTQVKPNQKLPIIVHLFNGATGKVVKAKVKKLDGTLLTTITLTDIGNGSYADQSFPMPAGVDFVVAEIVVYLTDGVTLDPDQTESSQDYGVIYPIIASPLNFKVECEDAGEVLAVIPALQSGDVSILLKAVKDDGSALDITGATEWSVKMKKSSDGTALVKNLASGVSIVDALGGTALLEIASADLALLQVGLNNLEVELDLGGKKHTRLLPVLDVQSSLFS